MSLQTLSAPPAAAQAGVLPGDALAVRNAVVDMISRSGCGFAERHEYCLNDSNMVDAIVQRLVDKHFAGQVPLGHEPRTKLVAYAHTDVLAAMRSRDGLRWLEARMRERFERPLVTTVSGRIVVDLGFVPAVLAAGPRARITVASSSHLDGGQWRSTEAAAHIARYALDWPNAPVIDVVVLIADSHNTRWTYRFERSAARVLVFSDAMPTGAYVTDGRVDAALTDYVAGRRSLATDRLRWVRVAQVAR